MAAGRGTSGAPRPAAMWRRRSPNGSCGSLLDCPGALQQIAERRRAGHGARRGTPALEVVAVLFDRDAFREVPRLVDVAAAPDCDVIREQLERNDHEDWHQKGLRRRYG